MYIMTLSTTMAVFSFSRSMWVERALSLVGVLREVSVSFACPFHCGYSFLLPFLSGLVTGLCIGLSLAVYLLVLSRSAAPSQSPSSVSDPVLSAPSVRQRSRLRGYLHE